jgi:hypothetical protein
VRTHALLSSLSWSSYSGEQDTPEAALLHVQGTRSSTVMLVAAGSEGLLLAAGQGRDTVRLTAQKACTAATANRPVTASMDHWHLLEDGGTLGCMGALAKWLENAINTVYRHTPFSAKVPFASGLWLRISI